MVPIIPLRACMDAPRCAFQPCVSPPTKPGGHCYYHLAQMVNGDLLGVEPLAPVMWLREVAAGYDPGRDEYGCIVWPFEGARSGGYGSVRWVTNKQRFSRSACRWLCELVHGSPPSTGEWHAAHECGRGHLGCTTPDHLSWKTPVENNADKKRHGTHRMGETHHSARLTDVEVRAILLDPRPAAQIGAEFRIGAQSVTRLKLGQRRRDVYAAVLAEGLTISRTRAGGPRLDGSQPAAMTEADVRAIRSSSEAATVLAERHATSPSNIRAIRKGLTWKHIL